MKNKGLGRGLDAIFESEGTRPAARAMEPAGEIAVDSIAPNPSQPRRTFDEEALAELADSISVLGVIQPITVRRDGERYLIISGERRWRAARRAGLETIPVYVREATDQTLHEMALVENIQREDLNPMEVALSLRRLMDECELTQEAVAERVGKKRATVANYLRLLSLPDEVQLAVKEGYISMGHAKAIAGAEKPLSLLKKVVKGGLSVRQTEAAAAGVSRARHEEREFPESYSRLVELLENIFSSAISIKGGNKIVISFNGEEDVQKFINKLSEK